MDNSLFSVNTARPPLTELPSTRNALASKGEREIDRSVFRFGQKSVFRLRRQSSVPFLQESFFHLQQKSVFGFRQGRESVLFSDTTGIGFPDPTGLPSTLHHQIRRREQQTKNDAHIRCSFQRPYEAPFFVLSDTDFRPRALPFAH